MNLRRNNQFKRLQTAVAAIALLTTMIGSFPAFARAQGGSAPRKGTVRTDTLWAQSLGIRKALTVYLPPSYSTATSKRFPVLYYLHGMWGAETDWTRAGGLNVVFDSLVAAGQPEAIVVMPDGDDGWYTTWFTLPDLAACRADTVRKEPAASYCVPWPHYDDYIARDVVSFVDRKYRTFASVKRRGIAGLSMGGYGAVALSMMYPDVFGAAVSHSGVVAPLYTGPIPFAEPAQFAADSIGLKKASTNLWSVLRLAFGKDTLSWWPHDPARLTARTLSKAKTGRISMPALRLDCGTSDKYIEQSRAFHASLTKLGVAHEYAEWPGVHDWKYWRAHVGESLTFLLAHTKGTTPAR